MFVRIGEIIGFLLGLLLILGLEQVYGLPLLFFTVVLLFSSRQVFDQRLITWGVAGLSLASMYQLSLSWGILLILGAIVTFTFSQRMMKSVTIRCLLISIIASLIVAVGGRVSWSLGLLISSGISLSISLVLIRNLVVDRGQDRLKIRSR